MLVTKKHRELWSHSTILLKIVSSQCVIKLTSFLSASCKLDVKNSVKIRILEKYHYGQYLF